MRDEPKPSRSCARALLTGILASVLLMGLSGSAAAHEEPAPARAADQSPAVSEGGPMNLLFIHHSCGGALLADPGDLKGGDHTSGERCLYESHPNGGGLRERLTGAGLRVHQASYGSLIGQDTDICHWRTKFATQMDRILRTERQDSLLPDGRTNRVVCFKSCFPNNGFTGRGQEPGDPDDCERTLANARAAYRALLPLFRSQPDVLFVAWTAPPLAEFKPVGVAQKLKNWLRPRNQGGALAHEFNTWLADREHGWLAGYELPNVVIFDFYDILTGAHAGHYSAYATRDGRDSHPSREGNQKAAAAFLPVLESAIAGMGWTVR